MQEEPEPMTKTIKASVARQQFSQLLNDVFRGKIRVVVEKSGIPVAAIISANEPLSHRMVSLPTRKTTSS